MELKDLKRIAQGGQAEIYALSDEKVLRVLRNPADEPFLRSEMEIMQALFTQGIPVPQVFEYTTADDRPALIVERIDGSSMLDVIRKNPLQVKNQAKTLAELHYSIAKANTSVGVMSAKKRAAFLTGKSTVLSTEQKDFVTGLLPQLPEGDSLCHGDFHPGNILVSKGRHVIIDWFGATRGDLASDAAHSYILMKNIPATPGTSRLRLVMMRSFGSSLAGTYLKAVQGLAGFDWPVFSKWTVIKAAERSFYGMPSEKDNLVRFIQSCMDSGTDHAADWYKNF